MLATQNLVKKVNQGLIMKFASYLQKKLKVKNFLTTEILTATRIFLKKRKVNMR